MIFGKNVVGMFGMVYGFSLDEDLNVGIWYVKGNNVFVKIFYYVGFQ